MTHYILFPHVIYGVYHRPIVSYIYVVSFDPVLYPSSVSRTHNIVPCLPVELSSFQKYFQLVLTVGFVLLK